MKGRTPIVEVRCYPPKATTRTRLNPKPIDPKPQTKPQRQYEINHEQAQFWYKLHWCCSFFCLIPQCMVSAEAVLLLVCARRRCTLDTQPLLLASTSDG